MSHLDDLTLAALASGDGDPASSAHATSCPACAANLASLVALTDALKEPLPSLEEPPASVWRAVAAATAEQAPERASVARLVPREVSAPRRWRPATLAVAASAAVILVTVAGVFGLTRGQAEPEVMATADLADLAAGAPAGTASVETRDDGSTLLVVDTTYTAPAMGVLEVWLIDRDIDGMISLGYLTADHGEFEIPPGFDVSEHPIVDISVEPLDGVPTHSGVSVTRGILDLA